MKITRKTSLVAIAAAAALTLAACGSDDDNSSSPETSASETVATSAPETSADGSETPVETPTDGSETAVETTDAGSETAAPTGAPVEVTPGTIAGAGASSQASAMTAWINGYTGVQSGVTVNYDAVGSGAGRTQFLSGSAAFAGSDAALKDEELTQALEVCGPNGAVEYPVYISPIAIPVNVEGVTSLNLKPATIAAIFNNEITNWNDEAIAADNPDTELPDLDIVPVHRSDDSGTSENFAEYLTAAAGDAWPHEPSDTWPVDGEAANGTSGMVEVVGATNGAIGYADASAVGQIPTVSVGVGSEFVSYSPEAAAAVVDASPQIEGRGEFDIALELARDTTESGAYPVVLVSYHVACASYPDAETADRVKSFLSYVISAEGQAVSAAAAGNAPISEDLRTRAQAAIDSITAG